MKYANTERTKNYSAEYFFGHIVGVAKNRIIDDGDFCLEDLITEFGITEAEAQRAKEQAVDSIKHDLSSEDFWNCPAMTGIENEVA